MQTDLQIFVHVQYSRCILYMYLWLEFGALSVYHYIELIHYLIEGICSVWLQMVAGCSLKNSLLWHVSSPNLLLLFALINNHKKQDVAFWGSVQSIQ